VAEKSTDGGPAKSLSYAGKTVLIEKRGGVYTYTVGGKHLPADEAKKFREVYEKAGKLKNEDVVPKKPVQVYEKWSLDEAFFKKISTDFNAPVNTEKSKATGRLTKTYTKDGQQYGVIEVKVDLVFDTNKGGLAIGGNIGMTMTVDTAIDGSSLDGVMKMTMFGKITTKQQGTDVEMQFDADRGETRTAVK